MSENQTVAIPIKRRVLIQELAGDIYLVTPDGGEQVTTTSAAAMREALNKALGIEPARRERKPKNPPGSSADKRVTIQRTNGKTE